MDSDLFNDINTLSAEMQSWEPENIFLESDDGISVDVMDYMEGGEATVDSVVYLAHNDDWSDPSSQKDRAKLVAHINNACRKAGFSMVVKEWDRKTEFGGKLRNIAVGGKLRLYCARGLAYRGEKMVDTNGDKKKKTKTSRPTCVEAKCPFKFNVFWFNNQTRWGLIAYGGNRKHHGHYCHDEENIRCTTTNILSEDDEDLANDLFECNQTPAEVDCILHHRSDISLTRNQVTYMKQKARKNKQCDDGPSTPASRFLSWLESNEKISYILLFDKGQSDMVHVRRPGRLEREREVMLHCVERQSGNNIVAQDVAIVSTPRVEDDPMEYINRIRRSMSIPDTNQILLAAAWCTDQERRLVSLFPDVMAADVTEQTNKEKRPLLLLGSLTSNNESFTFCRAFLPSMQRWVFDWFFSTAVPALFPQETLHRNSLMLTDGDSKEYGAFMDAAELHFPNSRHRLCSWHLMDRGLKKTRIYQYASSLNVLSTNYFNGMINWVKSWFYTLETMEEYTDSRERLFEWLATEEMRLVLGATIIDTFLRFIAEKLDPYKMRWLCASFLHIRSLDRKSTQFLEAENSVLKTQEGGPKPNEGIDIAAGNIDKQSKRRWQHKDRNYALAVDQLSIQHQEIHKKCQVNMYCLEKIIFQSDQGKEYSLLRESETSFLVKRSDSLGPASASIQTIDPNSPDFEHFIVPQYSRTRRVSIVEGKYMKCSCGLFSRCGYPCRHIYAVLKRPPRTQDTIPRYHVHYSHLFNRHEALTNCYKQEFMRAVPGPPLSNDDLSKIAELPICTNIPDFYLSSLPSRLLLSSKCFWANNVAIESVSTATSQSTANVAGNAPVRFRQELHLSQASFFDNRINNGDEVADNDMNGTSGDGDDFDDNFVDGIINNVVSVDQEDVETSVPDIDEEGIKKCIYECETANLEKHNQDNLFNSMMPYYREICNLGEGRPWMRDRISRRLMYVFEISDTEVNEHMQRTNRNGCVREGMVVSSRQEVSGPKHASRKRPMHSPAKNIRKTRK